MNRFATLSALLLLAFAPLVRAAEEPAAPIRVTVVVVLASRTNTTINEKLTALALEVQKRDETLTGFKLDTVLQKSIPVGESHTFVVLDKQQITLTIEKPKDKAGRVGLKIKPPGLDEICYTCACEKFFPIVTPHKTKAGEVLIIAIMAKPCTGKGP